MSNFKNAATAFVEMAHQIVWCTAASVDVEDRPRSRVLHPIWEFEADELTGWIATSPTMTKREHIQAHPYMSLNYWTPNQDTCVAECRAFWAFDDQTRERVWHKFKSTPPPLGYDPEQIPSWTSPVSDNFAVIRLEPWKLRVFPGTLLLKGEGALYQWEED